MAKDGYGTVIWKTPTLSTVIRMLQNPAYAGAYVYGRWDYSGDRRSVKTGKHAAPSATRGTLARPHRRAPSRLSDLGGIREQSGAATPELESRGQSRRRPRRDRPAAGARRLWSLRSQDGRPTSRAHERRSSVYVCQQGYSNGDPHVCQSMTSRAVDAGVVQAFLEAVSPEQPAGGDAGARSDRTRLGRASGGNASCNWNRRGTTPAWRNASMNASIPDHRLVASELERRWNEKLERVAQLEQAHAKAEADAQWDLTAEERAAISALSQDLPAIWAAPTTTHQDRKQLLRSAMEYVQLDGVSRVGPDRGADSVAIGRDHTPDRRTVPSGHRFTEDAG